MLLHNKMHHINFAHRRDNESRYQFNLTWLTFEWELFHRCIHAAISSTTTTTTNIQPIWILIDVCLSVGTVFIYHLSRLLDLVKIWMLYKNNSQEKYLPSPSSCLAIVFFFFSAMIIAPNIQICAEKQKTYKNRLFWQSEKPISITVASVNQKKMQSIEITLKRRRWWWKKSEYTFKRKNLFVASVNMYEKRMRRKSAQNVNTCNCIIQFQFIIHNCSRELLHGKRRWKPRFFLYLTLYGLASSLAGRSFLRTLFVQFILHSTSNGNICGTVSLLAYCSLSFDVPDRAPCFDP